MAPPNNRLMIKCTAQLHRFWYRLSGGRIGGRFGKAPILLLTTTGRKSGRRRTTPLLYLPDGENLVLVASNAGDDRHPAWYINLRANPRAEVQVGSERRSVVAETAGPEERRRLWARAVENYSGYADYEQRTSREIPVVVLRPASG